MDAARLGSTRSAAVRKRLGWAGEVSGICSTFGEHLGSCLRRNNGGVDMTEGGAGSVQGAEGVLGWGKRGGAWHRARRGTRGKRGYDERGAEMAEHATCANAPYLNGVNNW